ncbi:MAG: hypothetical protein JWN46_2000 [Acidimicrobiales bacterium]|nr:hypothetical protein [Acidimicrobiales bacterium]
MKEIEARWPADAVEVMVAGEPRWVLARDEDRLTAGPAKVTTLLGPFDPLLQSKDRSLLVSDAARAKALWPVLGRPGAVLVDGEVSGIWRPRKAGSNLSVAVQLWTSPSGAVRAALAAEAERLATVRNAQLAAVDFAS